MTVEILTQEQIDKILQEYSGLLTAIEEDLYIASSAGRSEEIYVLYVRINELVQIANEKCKLTLSRLQRSARPITELAGMQRETN